MVNENKRLPAGFIIAGVFFGLILPILSTVCQQYIPAEFYFSDNYLLKNLSMILGYVYVISLDLYLGLFICSVIYTKIAVTAIVSLPFILYLLINFFRVLSISNLEADNLAIVFNILIIIIVPVLWYAFCKPISLIKVKDSIKMLLSAVPVYIIYKWAYIKDLFLCKSSADLLLKLTDQLVPIVIYFISVLFMYLIIKDTVKPREAKKEAKQEA